MTGRREIHFHQAVLFACLILCASVWDAHCEVTESQFQIGINLSGSEYSWETYPVAAHLAYLKNKGIGLLRLPTAWEKFQPTLGSTLSETEVARLKAFLSLAAQYDMQVIIDLHDYGRYRISWSQRAASNHGLVAPDNTTDPTDVIGSAAVPVSIYKDFWTRLARALTGTPGLAGYDIMNEPNNMGNASIWPQAAQAAVDGIRSVDTNTTIYVEGYQWASAKTWQYNNPDLDIHDPANNIVYEAHQYFDNVGGRYEQSYDQLGATPMTGVDKIRPFLNWLKARNARGFLGEFAVPDSDPRWLVVLDNVLALLKQNNVSGTYWFYTYGDPSGANRWWPISTGPVFDISLMPFANGSDKPQWRILSRYMHN